MDAPNPLSLFHVDELRAQREAGMEVNGAGIRDQMPQQHRDFFSSLRYILVSAVAADGWPVATMLTGAPGFVSAPDAHTLQIALSTGAAGSAGSNDLMQDPSAAALAQGQQIGLLGIDLANRRRNRANGRLARLGTDGLTIVIDQSFGNCPRYIQRRSVHAAERPAPAATEWLTALDAEARASIEQADTFFIASHSRTDSGGRGGADISHRGGRPGFVHIDGNDLWIPDFNGNKFMNTLGNLLGEPRAALLFVDFETGDELHLQGEASIAWHPAHLAQFEGAERFWRFRVLRGWRRKGALPLRWTYIDQSPFTAQTGIWAEAAQGNGAC